MKAVALFAMPRAYGRRFRGRTFIRLVRFYRVLLAAGIMVLASLLLLHSGAPESSSSPLAAGMRPAGVPTYSGYVGYLGNDVVYPTEDDIPTFLPYNLDASNVGNSLAGPNAYLENDVAVGLSGQSGDLSEYFYNSHTGQSSTEVFTLDLFVGAAGQSQFLPNTDASSQGYEAAVIGSQITYTGLPSTAETVIQAADQSGVNVTLGNIEDSSTHSEAAEYEAVMSVVLDIVALLEPDIGVALGVASLLIDSGGAAGGYTNAVDGVASTASPPGPFLTGPGEVAEWSLIDNGTFNPSDSPNWGGNGFAQGYLASTTVTNTQYMSDFTPGVISIGAENLLNYAGDAGVEPGAEISQTDAVTYQIAPAVSIGSYVYLYPGGPPASGAQVVLQQTCGSTLTDFDVQTSSTGYWHFFADPGCQYSYYASGTFPGQPTTFTSPTVALPSSTTESTNSGQNFSATTVPQIPLVDLTSFTVTFTESGNPAGQLWSVTMNSETADSLSSTIVFWEDSGSYSFTVYPTDGYAANGGTVTVNGADASVPVAVYPYPLILPGTVSSCFGGGTCSGSDGDGYGTTCVASLTEVGGDVMFVAVSGWGLSSKLSVSDGVDSFYYIGGEYSTAGAALIEVKSEHGGSVKVTVTSTGGSVSGTCTIGQLSPGATVAVVGSGNAIGSGTSLTVTNSGYTPGMILALFSSTRPSGAWTLASPTGGWLVGGQGITGYNDPGSISELFAFNDTKTGTVAFTASVTSSVAISGFAVAFYLDDI
jgi:hypothetical protein